MRSRAGYLIFLVNAAERWRDNKTKYGSAKQQNRKTGNLETDRSHTR